MKRYLLEQFSTREIVALVIITLMSVLANLPEGYVGWLINRNLLLGALIAVVVVALFHYLKALLLLTISTLAIGANLPHEMAAGLGISQTALLAVLAVLIGLTLLNRALRLLPVEYAEDLYEDEIDLKDTLTLDLKGARQRMLEAIAHGQVSTVRKLLSMNPVAIYNINGTTPLHLAAERGYSSIVQLLIENGADLLAQDKDGQTPLDIALTIKKHVKTTNLLYDATIPLLTQAQSGTPVAS